VTLPNLAQTTDVTALLQRELTTAEQTYAPTLLASASGKVRSYTRQVLSQVLADTYTTFGTWEQRITLPQRPVTGITSITINGTAVAAGSYSWDRNGNIDILSGSFQPDVSGSYSGSRSNLWGPSGSTFLNYATGPNWNGPTATIVVVYDHGYANVPSDIADEVAGMVASRIASPTGISMEQIGGYKVSYARQSPTVSMVLTDDTKAVLNRYRLRSATVSGATPH